VTVALISTARRLSVFVLSHATYCAALGPCSCTRRRDGTLLAGSLTVPAIALAVRERVLRVEHSPAVETVSDVLHEGGPRGAPTTPVEVPDERRTPLVQSRRR
jgi:hypothetical protein